MLSALWIWTFHGLSLTFSGQNDSTMNSMLRTLLQFFLPLGKANLTGVFMLIALSAPAWATPKTTAQAPAVLTVSVSSATICAGASTTLTASGCPTTGVLRWSTAQAGTSIVVVPLQTTTYTALCDVTSTSVTTTTAVSTTVASTTALVTTVTTTTATATVQVYPPIVLTPTSISALCNGSRDGQVAINARGGTGALQYQFNGQGFQTTNTAFGNLQAGTYTVSVKDALGCIAQANVEVKQPPALAVSVTVVNPKCTGGSDGGLIAIASGGVGDYRYLLDGSQPRISGTFINLSGNTTYRLGVADKNNCVLFQTVSIGAPSSFSIALTTKPARCAGSADGTVAVAVAGGAGGTYQYQIGMGPFQTGTQFTGLAANTYEITVQDNLGCQGKQTAVVGQPTPLQLTAVARPVNCFGPNSGSITITPTGGTGAVQYQLSTGKTPQASNVFTGIAVGNYTVIGTDANGCTSPVSATITKADPLKVQATATAATCCVCPTGAVNLVSTGGSGTVRQYQLIGQPNQATGQINGLRPNTYRFRVIDEAGCADSVAAVVTDANALTLTPGMIKDVSCAGGANGEATVQVAGGKKPFTFYWATERRDTLKTFTATQASLAEGTYTVSVVDSNRCSTTTVFVPIKSTYPLPTKPAITQAGSSTLLVTDQPAGIQWYIRMGTAAGQPVPNATGPALVPYESGQYYVVVTANGCASPPSDPINFILTDLTNPDFGLSVRVVPNPIVDRLRIEIEQVDRSAVTVQLLDASGRAVMSGQIPAFAGKKQAEWPLTGISTGSYLLKVSAESRQSVLRVLVE